MRLWFFVLHKLDLQTRMCSHPVGLDVWFLVRPFVYFHTSCVWTAKALVRLHGCAGSPEPLLVTYVISTIISWAGSIVEDWTTEICLCITKHFVHLLRSSFSSVRLFLVTCTQKLFKFYDIGMGLKIEFQKSGSFCWKMTTSEQIMKLISDIASTKCAFSIIQGYIFTSSFFDFPIFQFRFGVRGC